jgi:hypothetical protein
MFEHSLESRLLAAKADEDRPVVNDVPVGHVAPEDVALNPVDDVLGAGYVRIRRPAFSLKLDAVALSAAHRAFLFRGAELEPRFLVGPLLKE